MSMQRRQLLQIVSYALGSSIIPLRKQFAIRTRNPEQLASPPATAKGTAKGGTEMEKVAGIGGLFFRIFRRS